MDSNRRFKRPRIVSRAVSMLREHALFISNGRPEPVPAGMPLETVAQDSVAHHSHPHLALVADRAADEGAPPPPPAPTPAPEPAPTSDAPAPQKG